MSYLAGLWNEIDWGFIRDLAVQLLSVLLCLTVHETCHGLMAYLLGDPTAKKEHRLSLNPLQHIDWLGLASMLLCGFGWAKPVPVDPGYFKKPKQGMALTALAGPVSNFLLAVLLLFLARVAAESPSFSPDWFDFLLRTAYLSVGLGLFNLIPIPPLDGSKVLAVLLPDRLYVVLLRYERLGMLLLLILMYLGIGDGVLSRAMLRVFQWLLSLVF